MSMELETRLDQVKRGFTVDGREAVVYTIDQFPYFRRGMQGTLRDGEWDIMKTTSEVRFSLFSNDKWSIFSWPVVRVIGDCREVFDIFTKGVHAKSDLSQEEGQWVSEALGWKLFEYAKYDHIHNKGQIEPVRSPSQDYGRIFRSEVKPFLRMGNEVNDGYRIYEMYPGWGSEGITVVADNRADTYHEETLDVYFDQDRREGPPIHIVRLAIDDNYGWYFDKMHPAPEIPQIVG